MNAEQAIEFLEFLAPTESVDYRRCIRQIVDWIRAHDLHAHWVVDGSDVRCSNCSERAPVIVLYEGMGYTFTAPYCQRCGAKMDQEVMRNV